MAEISGWRRLIGHQGTFLATLELWPPERAGKVRYLQSGYRALWSLTSASREPAIQTGPIDLVDAHSLAPGSSGNVLIHPLLPEAWQAIDAGATLTLLARSHRRRVIGEATVLERRGVPASAPLNLEPFEETPARARLRAVADSSASSAPRSVPPAVTVGAVPLLLLSSSWGPTPGRHETAPRSSTDEVELAARLPRLAVDHRAPIPVTVTDGELPLSAEIAYFAEIGPDGIPAGERRDVVWDRHSLLRNMNAIGTSWSLRIPAPGPASAVVVTFTFAPATPGTPHNYASWGFRLQ